MTFLAAFRHEIRQINSCFSRLSQIPSALMMVCPQSEPLLTGGGGGAIPDSSHFSPSEEVSPDHIYAMDAAPETANGNNSNRRGRGGQGNNRRRVRVLTVAQEK